MLNSGRIFIRKTRTRSPAGLLYREFLVDSGGTLNGHLLDAELVDEVSVLVHPALVSGTAARSFVRGPDPDEATDLDLRAVEELEDGD